MVWVGRHTHPGLPERIESHTSISSGPDTLSESQGGLASASACIVARRQGLPGVDRCVKSTAAFAREGSGREMG